MSELESPAVVSPPSVLQALCLLMPRAGFEYVLPPHASGVWYLSVLQDAVAGVSGNQRV